MLLFHLANRQQKLDALMSKVVLYFSCSDTSASLFGTDSVYFDFRWAAVSDTLNCQAFSAIDSYDSFAFQTSHCSLTCLSVSSYVQSHECAATTREQERGCTWRQRRSKWWTCSTDWRRCPWLTRSPSWMGYHRRLPGRQQQTGIHFDYTHWLEHQMVRMTLQGGTWASRPFLHESHQHHICNLWSHSLWRKAIGDHRETPLA